MNVKRLFLVTFLFFGIFGCDCFNGGSEWNIASFTINIFDKNYELPNDGVIEGDSAFINFSFEADFLSYAPKHTEGWTTPLYGTTCTYPGDEGLNDPIASIIVTSNSRFNDIDAGQSLNEKLFMNQGENINEWIADSEDWMYEYMKEANFIFTEQPQTPSNHIFTVKITLESGKMIEAQTEEIQWM